MLYFYLNGPCKYAECKFDEICRLPRVLRGRKRKGLGEDGSLQVYLKKRIQLKAMHIFFYFDHHSKHEKQIRMIDTSSNAFYTEQITPQSTGMASSTGPVIT